MAPNNSKFASKSEQKKTKENDSECIEEFKGNLIRNMYNLLINDVLCDITLIAGVDSFKMRAHKTVLASSCDYFNAMFCGIYKESENREIVLNDFDGNSLKSFIHYFYTGEMDLAKDNVVEIAILSDHYYIPKVLNICFKFLKRNINDENCIEYFDRQDIRYLKDFYLFVADYINRHFKTVKNSKNFVNLSYDGVKKILESDELNVSSEEDVVFAFTYWIKSDVESRKEHIKDLLPLIRMTLLKPAFIQEFVQPLYEMAKDLNLSAIIMDALYWQSLPDKSYNISVKYPNPRRLQDNLLISTKIRKEFTQNVYSYLSFSKKLNLETQLKDTDNVISLHKNYMIVDDHLDLRTISLDNQENKMFSIRGLQNWEYLHHYGVMFENEIYLTDEKGVSFNLEHSLMLCNHTFKKYDFELKRWSILKNDFNREMIAMVCLDKCIYYMFGEKSICKSFMIFNTSTEVWSTMDRIEHVIIINKPIAFNGSIYALIRTDYGPISLNKFNMKSGTWCQVSLLPARLCNDLHLINFNNSIHLVAALDDTYTMFQYESASKKWKNLYNLNIVGDLDSIIVTSNNFDY